MTALNGHQFPQQLTMFERTQDVIDKVDKIDAADHVAAGLSPREQWETPIHDDWHKGDSLRDVKLSRGNYVGRDGYDLRQGHAAKNLPPLRIDHNDTNGRIELGDGHHRLALYESLGDQEVPVWHSFGDPVMGGEETPEQWKQPHRRRR